MMSSVLSRSLSAAPSYPAGRSRTPVADRGGHGAPVELTAEEEDQLREEVLARTDEIEDALWERLERMQENAEEALARLRGDGWLASRVAIIVAHFVRLVDA